MRTLEISKQFKKGFKKALKDPHKDTKRLQLVIDTLQALGTLTSEYKPHPLVGNWRPSWECHVQPDFLLIYEVTEDTLGLIACGSHADLFT